MNMKTEYPCPHCRRPFPTEEALDRHEKKCPFRQVMTLTLYRDKGAWRFGQEPHTLKNPVLFKAEGSLEEKTEVCVGPGNGWDMGQWENRIVPRFSCNIPLDYTQKEKDKGFEILKEAAKSALEKWIGDLKVVL
ncbi:MAG: hypothetical protein J6Y62_07110 [Clostridia bacterium]|nr:hypothetical protein [Clostridia bacterium]